MDVKGIIYEDMDWINVTQNRVQLPALVNTVMKLLGT
jgi:hypothetical protein